MREDYFSSLQGVQQPIISPEVVVGIHNKRTEVGTELAESLASHGAFSRCILCTCFFLLVTMADKNALVKVLDRL